MPLKPSYLLLVGAGGIVAYSGIKGRGIASSVQTVLKGQSPSTAAQTTALITPAIYPQAAAGNTTAPTGPGQTATTVASTASVPSTLQKKANQVLGHVMVIAAGWGSQWTAFNNIVMAESGWDTTIHFGGGHGYVPGLAYGIPQALPGDKMDTAGSNWLTSAATQIKWMIGYIRSVYGDPDNAWAYHEQHGAY